MTLENLLRVGRLSALEPAPAEVHRLLASIARNLTDAASTAISDETRFDAAYKAIMQCALLAVRARGLQPSSNDPGQQATLIQALPLTLGVSSETWMLLDALSRRRDAAQYTGDVISPDRVAACITLATALQKRLITELAQQRPDLLP